MNAPDPRSSGVSGSGTLPDQGANGPEGPNSQSCEGKKRKAQKLRISLPAHVYDRYASLSPSERNKAIAAQLGSEDVAPTKLIAAADSFNRVGVLFNQYMRLAHQGRVSDELVPCGWEIINLARSLKP
jgi:hypothetical protein